MFLGAARDVRELLYHGSIQLHATLHPGEKSAREAVDLLHPFFFRDREGALVDECPRMTRSKLVEVFFVFSDERA